MNLRARLEQELNQLSSKEESSDGLGFALDLENGVLECELSSIDSLACAVRRLTFRSGRLAAANGEELRVISDHLARRVQYLLEPLALLEFDADGAVVQMRSTPPRKQDGGVVYYELLAGDGALEVSRYKKRPSEPRRLTNSNLTREAFCRLAEDITNAA